MQLGAFSISLTVKDLAASTAFYEKLGFSSFGGDMSQNWLILKNGETVIGLFQGMFEKNMLTFNPGWNQNAEPLDSFTDVRDLQRELKEQGVEFVAEADQGTTGPASFIIVDPDGNPVLVDQHR
jgi:catechol 2,3-dioxygenase-like lactoylglutathione lyase family enzyme